MSQTTSYNVSKEFIDNLKGHFGLCLLENIERERKDLQKRWSRASSWDIQKNVPLQACGQLGYPGQVAQELSKYWDVCPVLLEYIQTLAKFTLERVLLSSRQMSEEVSQLGQDVNQDAPIIVSDANAQMDIEISPSETNQSTSNMMPITNNTILDDISFQSVVSKSQKKKLRRKAKAECEATKAANGSHSSLDPSAKTFTPPTQLDQGDETLIPPPEKKAKPQGKPNTRKVVKNEASTVITGYQPAHNSQAFVQDIIVYDVPAKWDNYTTINALAVWGKVISMTVKRQKKYKTLHVKLEISQFFKNYEKHWMAPLMGFPVRWFSAS
ncbi:hypothetical protein RclHR1_01550022 [Rhizophagus clarus]|uniref:Uncharacterized protein n=1 Tax=Rhizophagus clarus TaxID=94130 RepID=A0A2Z6R800_9GLOM|nr:hypothetical protein RclHR1_01550022 [Rhizophagus clarus]GET01151.1 hypothetical protein GLOIN_2v1773465 [Rhizophagus clarus]